VHHFEEKESNVLLWAFSVAVWLSGNIVGRINSRVSAEMGDRLRVYRLGI